MKIGQIILGERERVELSLRESPLGSDAELVVRVSIQLHKLQCTTSGSSTWAALLRFRSQLSTMVRDLEGSCILDIKGGGRIDGSFNAQGHVVFLIQAQGSSRGTGHEFKQGSQWALSDRFACFPVCLHEAVDQCDRALRSTR